MRERRTYKRFDGIAVLAVFGCIGMLLFEGIFIFELYGRAVSEPQLPEASAAPVESAVGMPVPAGTGAPVPAVTNAAPAVSRPVQNQPAESEKAPVTAPVG